MTKLTRRITAAAGSLAAALVVTVVPASPAAAAECSTLPTSVICGEVYNNSTEAVFITRWGASGPTGAVVVLLPGKSSPARMTDVDAFKLQCPGTVREGATTTSLGADQIRNWRRIPSTSKVYVTYQTNCV
ncbi:hypothetical protein [Actinoplanes utahensis]|uniref:hypothetical protein n=1 Tax=Actinoplanes utahensis TaxID=1869 RepID=UPI001269A987|nr:hypothetical protein [Actinoplanes utahensis]GIF34681.1 hypothetical protein Aut01nite_76670 [Actinoplanes utahensis]